MQNIKLFTKHCLNCQVAQWLWKHQEIKEHLYLTCKNLLSFKRWEINIINILSWMLWENCWIITTINYATDWPVAKAVSDAMKATVADFLYNKIFTNYDSSRELLSDNSTNFLSCIVIYYLKKLKTQHRTMTLYHFCTNEKIENLNEMLNFMLTKYLMNKSTQLWNKYLSQTLFVT